jgi:putative ABC transport system ATP-binding protein
MMHAPNANDALSIRLINISREFRVGDQIVHALADVDLEIAQGEYVSIMGPSVSGKSTLLNILGLLDTPTRGEYWLAGESTASMRDDDLARARQRRIGFIFQSFHLIPRMTSLENVELPLVLAARAPKERREAARAALNRVGLHDRYDHRPDQLSGGQRQRVAIARSIVMDPGLLLADEPTGNLDTRSGTEVVETIEELNRAGLTLIVVTHDHEIAARSRRSIVLRVGRGDEGSVDDEPRVAG